MILNEAGLQNKEEWIAKGYALPQYDRAAVAAATAAAPTWVHFGGGNLFRAFHANLAEQMLNKGVNDKGVIVIEGFDYEIVEKSYRPNDNLSVLCTLKVDGTVDKTVVGAITESCILDSENDAEYSRLKEIFANPSLQLATFTITEKGYSLTNAAGEVVPAIIADFAAGPEKPATYIGKVASLLYSRYAAGELPMAMVSTDNCSHNGDKLYNAMNGFAVEWAKNGLVPQGFVDYVNDKSKCSFPWSMIDKITPRPDASVEAMLKESGLEGLEPVITSKRSYCAPFVNAEETQYLVIEDAFPNGRPALDTVGVIFTERETVDKVERMKVTTCLNPLHTCLAVYGCLLGYNLISAEMKDPELVKFVKRVGYVEGLPVVTDPGVLNPKEFIDTVIETRLPNPFMPDSPQRIATDTSQKLAIRFGETVKSYIKNGMDLADLKLIPLELAGWMRYLMAIDDNGEAFEVSPDPLMDAVAPLVADIKLGDTVTAEQMKPLLGNTKIFGVDYYEIGMAEKIVGYFNELIAGKGAIRATLKKYTAE